MFYVYECQKPVMVVTDSINKVEAQNCIAYEYADEIPFQDYDYYALDDMDLDIDTMKYFSSITLREEVPKKTFFV